MEAYAQQRCVLLFDGQHLAGNISLICYVLRQDRGAAKALLLSVQSCFIVVLPIPTVYMVYRLSIPLALPLLAYFYIPSCFTLSTSF